MRRIESPLDYERGTVTYDLGGGRWATFDAETVRKYGIKALLESEGVEMPTERVPVMQFGRRVGSVTADFDLAFARSRSPFYDVRPGDLVRERDAWVAARNLGARDLDCLVGFQRDEGHNDIQEELRKDTLSVLTSYPQTPS